MALIRADDNTGRLKLVLMPPVNLSKDESLLNYRKILSCQQLKANILSNLSEAVISKTASLIWDVRTTKSKNVSV